MKRTPRRGFTLVEILVVAGVVALLMGILIPAISKARESAKRTHCAANLRGIGQALLAYATSNRNQFPRIIAQPTDDDAYMEAFEPAANVPNPFESPANGKNASYAALFLLVRNELIGADKFVCPSTIDLVDNFEGSSPKQRSNFTNIRSSEGGQLVPTNCSYSYANMYPNRRGISAGVRMRMGALKSGFPLVADKSLRRCALYPDNSSNVSSDGRPGNSRNHNKSGQNVLYADGSVGWSITNRAGISGDNIYTRESGSSCNMLPVLTIDDAILQEP